LSEGPLLVGDGDRLRFTGALVGGGNLHDTVGLGFRYDLDLGTPTAWSRRDVGELELAEEVVLFGQRMLTLEDLDKDGGLVVGGGEQVLTLTGGDGSVTGDELGVITPPVAPIPRARVLTSTTTTSLSLSSPVRIYRPELWHHRRWPHRG